MKFDQEIANKICAQMTTGMSLTQICQQEDVPNKPEILEWLRDNETFRTHYARAREMMLDLHGVDNIIDLADNVGLTAEQINKARLQIDSRKWVMSKLLPKKYGERLEHAGKIDVVETLIIQRTPKTIEHNVPLPVIDAHIKE
jgi:hypothetical protein